MKSILTFSKWTKKMSKIDLPKMSLLRKFFVSIMKNYRHKLNQKKIFYDDIFLYFFCGKGFRVFFVAYLGENGNENLEKKRK